MFCSPNILLLPKELAEVGQNGDGFDLRCIGQRNCWHSDGFCSQSRATQCVIAGQGRNVPTFGSRIGSKQLRVGSRVILFRGGILRIAHTHLGNAWSLDLLRLHRNIGQRTLNGQLRAQIQTRRHLGDICGQRRILIVGIQPLRSTGSSTTHGLNLSNIGHHRVAHIGRARSSLVGFRGLRAQHIRRGCKRDLFGFTFCG